MNLKTNIQKLKALAKEHPEALALPVVYAQDDEGNQFQEVTFDPCFKEWPVQDEEIKATCLN